MTLGIQVIGRAFPSGSMVKNPAMQDTWVIMGQEEDWSIEFRLIF